MKKVAIIISTYNSGNYLKETIRSCKNQSYKNKEIIVVDDASEDFTVDFLKALKNVKVFLNKRNKGISKNLNFALNKTDADYVIFLGHDDILPFTHVEKMVEEIESDPEIALVHSNALKIDSFGKLLNFSRNSFEQIKKSKKPMYYLSIDNFIQSCGLLLDRNKFLQIGGWDEKYKLYGEWLIYIKIAKQWKIHFCEKTYGYYRVHEKSTMKMINLEQRKEIREYKQFCREVAMSFLDKKERDMRLIFRRGLRVAKESFNNK